MAELEQKKLDSDNENVTGAEAAENVSDASSNTAVQHNHHPELGFQPGCGGCGPNPYREKEATGQQLPDGKVLIDEDEYHDATGFEFSSRKKWTILSIIFLVQCSMNFNASAYGNAVGPITEKYGVSTTYARAGQGAFLIAYGFGCEFWAPFSEEFGRWPILQLSLFLVNIWQIPCAVAPNVATIIAFRTLGGLSSAGGSVTLGMVADLYQADEQQWAVLFVVLSSVGGSVLGPIFCGFLEYYAPTKPQWNFWTQLIFGAVVQIIHFCCVPETRVTVMLDKKAKKLRKQNPEKFGNLYGPNEIKEKRLEGRELLKVWVRPFVFFFTEPIVLCLSLLSGFSDALIFTFLEAFSPVFEQWGFNAIYVGLAFIAILVGYLIAYVMFIPDIISQKKRFAREGFNNVPPERRLYALLFLAPLETIGLFGFAFTSYGPAVMKGTNTWIAPMIFASLIGIANFAIYYTTIDYMVSAYGPYSASATGGNGFARDVLAGIAAFYASPLYGVDDYSNLGMMHPYNLEYGSLVLALIALLVTVPIFLFYFHGEYFRERSKFAQTLSQGREQRGGRRMSSVPGY